MPDFSCIITAAGAGTRFDKEQKKQFYELKGKPILHYSLEFFSNLEHISEIIVTLPADDFQYQSRLLFGTFPKISTFMIGGDTRQESVYKALKQCFDTDFVIIHDAVRPFIDRNEIEEMMGLAVQYNAVIPGTKIRNTIKRVQGETVCETIPRDDLIEVYTPQIFKLDLVIKYHEQASRIDRIFTDDASLFEYFQEPVRWYEMNTSSLKITTKDDLKLADFLMKQK